MDNTELHYLTYDPEEIWNEMIYAYVQAGGDVLYPGDEKEMLLRSVQADIVSVFAGVDNALRMQTLRYAVGEYLDVLGEQRGCSRLEAAKAVVTLEVTAASTCLAQTVPASNLLTADGVTFWRLDSDLVLAGGSQTQDVTATCETAGVIGNTLTEDTVLTFVTPVAGVTVSAKFDASGGRDKELDDAYRERIRTWMSTASTAGPKRQYEAIAKATPNATIRDAFASNVHPTTHQTTEGTVFVYILGEADEATEDEIQAVQDHIAAVDATPLTDRPMAWESTRIPYNIVATAKYNGSDAVEDAINAAVEEYKEWQNWKIGRPFDPDRLRAMLYNAGATDIQFSNTSTMGSVTRTPIYYPVTYAGQHWFGTVQLTLSTS